jgi:hypothetical protein
MRLLVFAAVVELLLPISARSELPREIPFRYQDGLIWLKVELGGKKERLNFLLDSGSSVSAIDLHTAHTLGVNLGDRQSVEGVSGQDFGYRVNDFQAMAGGIALPKSVLAIDLGAVSESCHQHIDGILGVDFFQDRVVQIDFKAGRICLLKNCKVNGTNRCKSGAVDEARHGLRFSFGVGGYENGKEANEWTIDRSLGRIGSLYQHFGPPGKTFFQ